MTLTPGLMQPKTLVIYGSVLTIVLSFYCLSNNESQLSNCCVNKNNENLLFQFVRRRRRLTKTITVATLLGKCLKDFVEIGFQIREIYSLQRFLEIVQSFRSDDWMEYTHFFENRSIGQFVWKIVTQVDQGFQFYGHFSVLFFFSKNCSLNPRWYSLKNVLVQRI